MTTQQFPEALDRIRAAAESGMLQAGSWGNGATAVCMMSAFVPGAESAEDCVTAGWPEWLSVINVSLFDENVGVDNEDAARLRFALDVAEAVTHPVNMDKARDLFLIRRLDTGDHSALDSLRALPGDWAEQIASVEAVVALLLRRSAGEEVSEEMDAARRAAGNAADASYAAGHAVCAAAACAAAGQAAYAAAACAAAGHADYAAYRADLIASFTESQETGQ